MSFFVQVKRNNFLLFALQLVWFSHSIDQVSVTIGAFLLQVSDIQHPRSYIIMCHKLDFDERFVQIDKVGFMRRNMDTNQEP